jgi:CRP-like cAMP-binding protein
MEQAGNRYYLGEVDLGALIKRIEGEERIEWEQFLDYTEELELEPGTTLIRQFEHDDTDAYVLTKGKLEIRVRADDGEDLAIAQVSPTAVLGEQSFLDDGARTATVVAIEPSTVHRLTAAAFGDLCDNAPDLGCAFMLDVARSLSLRNRVYGT